MENKRAGGRKQYLNDFRPSVNGEYIYTGGFYKLEMEQSRVKGLRTKMTVSVIITAAFVLTAGILPAAGSISCFYVILPFLAVMICCFVSTWKICRLLASGLMVREYIYEKTVPTVPGWLLAESISAAATLIGEAVYLIINGVDGREVYTAAFICMLILTVSACLMMRSFFREIRWIKNE